MLDRPLTHVSFAAVDVETTGLDAKRDHILEIAVQRVDGLRLTERWSTLVEARCNIPLVAQRIHGITNAMLIGQPSINAALRAFLDFVGDAVLVEHSNGAFDVLFLEAAHGRPLPHTYVNTCALSRCLEPLQPKHSLDACCQRYGIVNVQAHRAAADAEATARLLVALLQRAGPRFPRLSDLVREAAVDRAMRPRQRWAPRSR